MSQPSPRTPANCARCGKPGGRECSHVDCPSRKPVTADVPAGNCEAAGYGCYRRLPTNKE